MFQKDSNYLKMANKTKTFRFEISNWLRNDTLI